LIVYARDLAGNTGASAKVNFTIDSVPPIISLHSPQNKTYDAKDLQLTFTLNEPIYWIGYSLDGNEIVTITRNTTITDLSHGSHTITVYATDSAGNMGNSIIHFSVPEPFPIMWITTVIILAAGGGIVLIYHFKPRKTSQKS
jgi:hypothetical protein